MHQQAALGWRPGSFWTPIAAESPGAAAQIWDYAQVHLYSRSWAGCGLHWMPPSGLTAGNPARATVLERTSWQPAQHSSILYRLMATSLQSGTTNFAQIPSVR